MIGSALAFVLARLDQLESPVFSHEELARFPAADLATLLRDGILFKSDAAEQIERPSRLPVGGRLAVCHTARGIFGCPREGEPYFDPFPLTEDEVRQYEVCMDRLIDRMRRDNGIDGTGCAASGRTFALGQRHVDAWGTVDVFFALGLRDDAAILSTCQHLKPEAALRSVVLLTPTVVPQSPERRRAVNATGVIVEALREPASRGSLAVSWSAVLGAPDPMRGSRPPKRVRVFRRDGSDWTVAYDGLLKQIPHLVGMKYIQILLERPSMGVSAADLLGAAGRGGRIRVVESATRLSRGRKRDEPVGRDLGTEELARQEAAAKLSGDTKRLRELRAIRSLTASDRRERQGKPSRESKATKGARQSVTGAIKRAIKQIRGCHATLGVHLTDSVEFGHVFLYKGDPTAPWETMGASS